MQALYILLAILLGIIFPQTHQLTFLIRYNLMIMLFIAFLGIDLERSIVKLDHVKILILNVLLPILWFLIIYPLNHTLAMGAFVIGMAPTAAGAPVIAGFLKSRVEFVTASVLLTNPASALFVPIFLPFLLGASVSVPIGEIILPVFSVVFIPLGVSLFIKYRIPLWLPFLYKIRWLAFHLFLLNVLIASGKATDFILNQSSDLYLVFWIAITSGSICFLQFQIGARIGKKSSYLERSLSLGRKNSMFAIWVSLTFLTPIVALAPMFYILFQNIYNTIEIFQVERRE